MLEDGQASPDGRTLCVMQLATKRRLPIGAEVISLGETHFRVWAPKATKMAVAIEESAEPNAPRKFFSLEPEADG
jgi:1,4-alpha-glucan branching enzyme